MHGSTDDILDRVRSREATGVFHSRKTLDAAVQDLLVAGIDRADIDVSAFEVKEASEGQAKKAA